VSETVFARLAAALDMVVMEQVPGGTFVQIGDAPPPEWFTRIYRTAGGGRRPKIAESFPGLSAFLHEAEAFWGSHDEGRLDSGDFMITDDSGRELPITAIAITLKGRRFLVIQLTAGFEDRQRILQRAREQALTHEQVIRKVHSLRRPLALLVRLADDLARPVLSDGQREQVSGIKDHLQTMSGVLDELPKLPATASTKK
jgi:hypothetical protein